jgi:hypothetical protein
MHSFGPELVQIINLHSRMTAVTITNSLRGMDEGQVPRQTSHSLRKPPTACNGSMADFRGQMPSGCCLV